MKNNSKADLLGLRVLLAAIALLILTQPSFATIINVPTDYASIQEAIVASSSGDTVYVSPGTYVENINFLGKNILLKSTDGAATTILRYAGGSQPLVSIVSGEGRDAILDDLTITGATAAPAIHITNSNPIVRNCRIEECNGIAINIGEGAPIIEDNFIHDIEVYGITTWGGAAYLTVIRRNSLSNIGRFGMNLRASSGAIHAYENYIGNCHDGINLEDAWNHELVFENNVIHLNQGLGILVQSGNKFIVSHNTVVGAAQGIEVSSAAGSSVGGGSNIIAECSSVGLFDLDGDLKRTILWNNPSNGVGARSSYLIADPRFVSPETGDFRLNCESPAIDAGDPGTTDPDGSYSEIGAIAFNHIANSPIAKNFALSGEDAFQVISPSPAFVWIPVTSSVPAIHIDTLMCVVDAISGDTILCEVDTSVVSLTAQLGYEFELGIDDDWSVAELMASGEVNSSDTMVVYSGTPLSADQTCFARLRLRDETGWGCWRHLAFRRNAAPSVPMPINPENGARLWVEDSRLVTAWSTDVERDSVRCIFEVYSDQTLTLLVLADTVLQTSSPVLSNPLSGLQAGTEYWWRAKSTDGYDESQWSVTRNFVAWDTRSFRVPEDYSTIQAAVNFASGEDTIWVGPGTYTESVQLKRKSVCLISTAGPDSTIFQSILNSAIAAHNSESLHVRGFHFVSERRAISGPTTLTVEECRFTRRTGARPFEPLVWLSGNTRITNCTFDGQNGNALGGFISPSDVSIIGCRFLQIEKGIQFDGNLVSLFGVGPQPLVLVISGNTFVTNESCPAINATGPIVGSITNNTFVGFSKCIVVPEPDELNIANNIFTNCTGVAIDASTAIADYNAFWQNGSNYAGTQPGPHDITADPLFVDPANGDYSLMCNSPCIDMGDPASEGFSGKQIDIGAFEYEYVVGNATASYGDNAINISDIVFLINYIFIGGAAPCPVGAGMADCDETITILDAVHLVSYLFANGAPPCVDNR